MHLHDWNAYRRQLVAAVGDFAKLSPDTVKGYVTLGSAGQKVGRLGNKTLMLANMCVESHVRELLEQGFDVAVVKDATAAPRHPVWGDGYAAALINFAYLAAVMTTDEVIDVMKRGASGRDIARPPRQYNLNL
jgi:hypothetical protein